MKVGILGATGAVGKEMLKVMEEKNLPIDELRLFASSRSAGKVMKFHDREIVIETANEHSFNGLDYVLGAVENEQSRMYAPMIQKAQAVYIDNSSAFRLDPNVPLVVPQINPDALKNHHGIIANPNCVTIIGLMACAPLHQVNPIKRIIASSYQAVSGAGAAGMDELLKQMKDLHEGKQPAAEVFSHQIAYNLIPQIGGFDEVGYTSEEMKFQNESRKILSDSELKVSCTCVRVPVLRSHSISMNIELTNEMSVQRAKELINAFEGVRVSETYPTPMETSDQDTVFVGRIRKDLTCDKGLALWCCGDQIRKGAASNAIEIMEALMK
jgi:aspartate-semialdehyde dehydrogenase